MKRVIYVDVEKCLACKSCELECAVAHSESKDLFKAIREKPLPQSQIKIEAGGYFGIPILCMHCEDAPCIAVCPTKAIKKLGTGEPVIVEDKLCIGCKLCILICPFGVLKMNQGGKVVIKCDMCIEKLKKNEKPACVLACPTHALEYKSIDEITDKKRQKIAADFLVNIKTKKNK